MKQKRIKTLFWGLAALTLLYNTFFITDQLTRVRELQIFSSRHQAQGLDALIKSFWSAYQERFLHEHIPFEKTTIRLLPVTTTPEVSRIFSRLLHDKATIRSVSDRPRNPDNMANPLEMETIRYFRQHPEAKEFYRLIEKGDEELFFYATPLHITRSCLTCHGKREEAPPYIRTHYSRAYGYRIGELRGITGIYLSQKALKSNIASMVYKNIGLMVGISLLALIFFYLMLRKLDRKERLYTERLEKEVALKTIDLEMKSQELAYRLYHDPLTGLPNRNALIRDLAEESVHAVILLNIDDFNEINDFYGHQAGDSLLQSVAEILKSRCRTRPCTLYRMPSDEFALLIHRPLSKEDLERLVKELIDSVNTHDFTIDGNMVHLRIGAGISTHRPDTLITADMAMKRAKTERRAYLFYDEATNLSQHYRHNLEWAERLKTALEEDRVVPYYQPIVSAQTSEVVIYEALMRIVDAQGIVHTPFEFLEIAKRTRYYPQLTRRMIERVMKEFADLPYHISLNISYLDIVNPETMEFLLDRIAATPDPSRFHFEILESEGIEEYDKVYEATDKLKAMGCHISLDDFGSGYSNFEHILKLRVDLLKIDGSLVRQIDSDDGSRIVVQTIVDFARRLGIDTCAEFVRNASIQRIVTELGVTYLQGYHICEPRPIDELPRPVRDDLV